MWDATALFHEHLEETLKLSISLDIRMLNISSIPTSPHCLDNSAAFILRFLDNALRLASVLSFHLCTTHTHTHTRNFNAKAERT